MVADTLAGQPVRTVAAHILDSHMSPLHDRLNRLFSALGWDADDIARHCDVDLSSVYRWRGGTRPNANSLQKIADAAGVSLEWLQKGEGDPPELLRQALQNGNRVGEPSREIVAARYTTQTVSLAEGSAHAEAAVPLLGPPLSDQGELRLDAPLSEWREHRMLRLAYHQIRQYLGDHHPTRVGAAYVQDSAMSPIVKFGDIVFYEPTAGVMGSGKYLLAMDGYAMVRQVQRRAGGVLRLSGINVDREDLRRDGDKWVSEETGYETNIEVIGRYLGTFRHPNLDDILYGQQAQATLQERARASVSNG